MPIMLVKHKVADFNQWKEVFDSMQTLRNNHGWMSHEVYRDAGDPNTVVIVNRVSDIEQAKAYGTSDELKSAMSNAGVMEAPQISFLAEADTLSYL